MLRMPLKLKWGKKSGRYELSQEIYVLTIFVGDFSLIQCTLATESTARQCVDYLCEKMDLNQAEIFGFRFQMRFNDPDRRLMRWVEMDKPLRKQLEKWACKPRQVQLAILYHTPNVFSLHDQMARSLYFMLLKLDVLNGKYTMDMEKYINLAAYSLQVENSDFDRTLHTMDYLRSVKLLPQHLCRNSQQLDECLVKILTVYERLIGMQPSYAAFLYIVDVQQCEGYGEECFQAKDDESTEVKLGYSLEEIFVKRYNGSTLKYKWPEIKDIVALKRNLAVKCLDGNSAIFALEDCDMAKYVNMVLNWQLRYATTDAIQQKSVPMSINNLQGGIRTFGAQQPLLFRHSNVDIHSTRTTNSIDMGVTNSTAVVGSSANNGICVHHHQPCTSSLSSSSNLLVNRFNTSSLFNVNSLHNAHNCQSTVHSVQSFSHPPISATLSVNCNRSSTPSQLILPPSVSTPTLTQNCLVGNGVSAVSPIYRPSNNRPQLHTGRPAALSLPQTPPTCPMSAAGNQVDADWLKLEQREILKQLLAERKSNKSIGSSPEIHMLGTNNCIPPNNNFNGVDNSKNYAANFHLMRKAQHPRLELTSGANFNQRTANYSDEKSSLHTSSNPDFCCSKWCSTPDLLSAHATFVDPVSDAYAHDQSSRNRRGDLVHRESCPNYSAASSSSVQQSTPPPSKPYLRTNVYRGASLQANGASHLRVNTSEHASLFEQSEMSPEFRSPPISTIPHSAVYYSQGHVVSGVSRAGQPITYPIPSCQTREQILNNNALPAHRSPGRSGRAIPSQTTLLVGSSRNSKENQFSATGSQLAYSGGSEANGSILQHVHHPITNGVAALPLNSGLLLSSAGASLISSMEEEDDVEGEEERSSPLSSSCSCSANVAVTTEHPSSSYVKTLNTELNSTSSESRHRLKQRTQSKKDGVQKNVFLNGTMLNHNSNGSRMASSKNELFVSPENGSSPANGALNLYFANGISTKELERSSSICNNNNSLDEAFLNSLNAKLAVTQAVEMEFAGIVSKRLSAGFSTSQCPHNQPRNREGRVFPYEDTRVMLTPQKRNPDGYINASNIQVPIGDNKSLRYIVTQAPMRNTIDDFWQMVWESGARAIVMLVNPHQIQKSDTIPTYWPSKTKEKLNLGGYFVKLVSSSTSKFQTTSVLSLKSMSRGDRRTIYHLYCADFAEDGVPSSEDSFMGFIDAVNSVKRHIENERRDLDSAAYVENSTKSRSRSIGRRNHSDMNNRLRAQSIESSNATGGWKKKLSFGAASHNSTTSGSSDNQTSVNGSNSTSSAQSRFVSATSPGNANGGNPSNGNNNNYHKYSQSNNVQHNKISSQSTFYTNRQARDDEQAPLTVVHCTDGAAESGVYVLVEVLIRCIENNVDIEIAQVLRSLRQQRMCLIKNASQYRFVYELIVSFLQQSRLI